MEGIKNEENLRQSLSSCSQEKMRIEMRNKILKKRLIYEASQAWYNIIISLNHIINALKILTQSHPAMHHCLLFFFLFFLFFFFPPSTTALKASSSQIP